MDMDLMELALWKNILHMIRMNITIHFRWGCLHYIILEEKTRHTLKSGLIISCVWLNCIHEKGAQSDDLDSSLSYLNAKEKDFLMFLLKKRLLEFTPIDVSKMLGVTNKNIKKIISKLK